MAGHKASVLRRYRHFDAARLLDCIEAFKTSMRTPSIGKPVRGSRTGRPIMVVLDVLGRRTVLRILWELQSGPMSFRVLQDACGTNSAHLNTRLRELRELELVELAESGYQLTAEGWKLRDALIPLADWARRWGRSAAAKAAMGPTSE